MTYKTIALSGVLIATLSIAACGNDSNNSGSTSAVEQSVQTEKSAPTEKNTPPEKATNVALPTSSLDRAALFGLVPDTIIETAPCPFLSNDTAIATAVTNFELHRREVSNEECRWSKNAGFSIRVSVEPTSTATPLSERAYNIETPPVLKEQSEPGENAVILYDTAWDKELPYAIGFEQNDKLVEVFVTGMKTTPELLSATAIEIASKLPTAPLIEKQYREIKPALDFCDVWTDESISFLIGATDEESLNNSPYGVAGCKWGAGWNEAARTLILARYKQGDTKIDKVLEMGGQPLDNLGDRAVILTRPAKDNYLGDTTIWVDVDEHQFNLILSGTIANHDELAVTLMENMFSRIN